LEEEEEEVYNGVTNWVD